MTAFTQNNPPKRGQTVLTPSGRKARVEDIKEFNGVVRCVLCYLEDEFVDLQPELLREA